MGASHMPVTVRADECRLICILLSAAAQRGQSAMQHLPYLEVPIAGTAIRELQAAALLRAGDCWGCLSLSMSQR
jgi:hypothetical protein